MKNWPFRSCFSYCRAALFWGAALALVVCAPARPAVALDLAAVAPEWSGGSAAGPRGPSEKPVPQADMPGSWSVFHQDAKSTVSIFYPQVDNHIIDNELALWADVRLRTFVAGVAALGEGKSRYGMRIDYSLSRTGPRFVSVVFRISTETGGSRPDAGLATFTYDLDAGNELTYEDIFSESEGLLDFLSEYSRAELLRKLGTAERELILRGTAPNKENFAYFAIRPDGLELFFPPYQVAPSALGEQHVLVPLEKLKPYGPDMKIWERPRPAKSNKPNAR